MNMKERIPSAGNWLTQATLAENEERQFWTKVSGYGDLDNLFTEWSDSQKEEWERAHPSEEEVNE